MQLPFFVGVAHRPRVLYEPPLYEFAAPQGGAGTGSAQTGASDPVQELRGPGVAWTISVEEPFHTRGETGR